MISFTGSTEVGKLMMRYAGESNLKRVALECGGKSPHVVMADADLEAAASGIAWGIYYNTGETCHAGSRVIVHERVKDALVAAIERVARTITLGHPFDPATQMGALIDRGHSAASWATSTPASPREPASHSAAGRPSPTPAAATSRRPCSTTSGPT